MPAHTLRARSSWAHSQTHFFVWTSLLAAAWAQAPSQSDTAAIAACGYSYVPDSLVPSQQTSGTFYFSAPQAPPQFTEFVIGGLDVTSCGQVIVPVADFFTQTQLGDQLCVAPRSSILTGRKLQGKAVQLRARSLSAIRSLVSVRKLFTPLPAPPSAAPVDAPSPAPAPESSVLPAQAPFALVSRQQEQPLSSAASGLLDQEGGRPAEAPGGNHPPPPTIASWTANYPPDPYGNGGIGSAPLDPGATPSDNSCPDAFLAPFDGWQFVLSAQYANQWYSVSQSAQGETTMCVADFSECSSSCLRYDDFLSSTQLASTAICQSAGLL